MPKRLAISEMPHVAANKAATVCLAVAGDVVLDQSSEEKVSHLIKALARQTARRLAAEYFAGPNKK